MNVVGMGWCKSTLLPCYFCLLWQFSTKMLLVLYIYIYILFHSSDTEAELNAVKNLAEKDGVFACVICSHFSEGSKGAKELAEAVVAACNAPNNFKYLYDVKVKI